MREKQQFLIVSETSTGSLTFPTPIKAPCKDKEAKIKPAVPIQLNIKKKRQVTCNLCLKVFKFNCHLKKHNCIKKCKFCGHESPTALANSMHLRSYHPDEYHEQLYPCDLCDRKFKTKDGRQSHKMLKHIRQNLPQFICDLDGKIWNGIGSLKAHMATHIQDYIKCQICGKEIKKSSMACHMTYHYPSNPPELLFKCKSCPKVFKRRAVLKRHEQQHDKKYECPICKEKLGLKLYVERHLKAHAAAREKSDSYECKLCGQKFTNLIVFSRHKLIHGGSSKTFKCTKCDYASTSQKNLNKHQEKHKVWDEKNAKLKNPMKCDKCPAMLRNRQAVKCHMMNVHPAAPYECDICGRIINAKTNVTKHMKIHMNLNVLDV